MLIVFFREQCNILEGSMSLINQFIEYEDFFEFFLDFLKDLDRKCINLAVGWLGRSTHFWNPALNVIKINTKNRADC